MNFAPNNPASLVDDQADDGYHFEVDEFDEDGPPPADENPI